jgi:cell division septum initiation protein DivIVA
LEQQIKRLKQRVEGLELELKHFREQNDLLRQQINDLFK